MAEGAESNKGRFLEKGVVFGRKIAPGLAGGLSGAAISAVLGGPLGGFAGAAVGAIAQTLGEILARSSSDREEKRQAFVAAYAISLMKERLDDGAEPRSDDFWDPDASGRSDATQLFEGILLKCKSEYEEKKLPFLAAIFSNVAFRNDIDGVTANYVLERATRLTYRQICAIALAKRADQEDLTMSWGKHLNITGARDRDPALSAELADLSGLVHAIGNSEEPPFLEKLGDLVFGLMGLDAVPHDDLAALKRLIESTGGP